MKSLWTPICERVGIEVPIFGFAHDVDAVSAISSCGGYGVYGATRRFPKEIEEQQLHAVLESDVDMLACGIGAPPEVVAEAKRRGKLTLALIGSPHHVVRALSAG